MRSSNSYRVDVTAFRDGGPHFGHDLLRGGGDDFVTILLKFEVTILAAATQRQHAFENAIAFEDAVVQRTGDVQRHRKIN